MKGWGLKNLLLFNNFRSMLTPRDFKLVSDMGGKLSPNGAQADEMQKMQSEHNSCEEPVPEIPDGCFIRSPRKPSHERRRKWMKVNANQNG